MVSGNFLIAVVKKIQTGNEIENKATSGVQRCRFGHDRLASRNAASRRAFTGDGSRKGIDSVNRWGRWRGLVWPS